MRQISINFDASPIKVFATCRDYIASLVHQQGRPHKAIAADMDMSPSDLSRKLSPSGDDHRKFSLDDLELFVATTGDKRPIQYLAEKYLANGEMLRIAALEAELASLKSKKRVGRLS